MMSYTNAPVLDFDWADTAWEDPLTGTRVVRLSPGDGRSYVTAYFRIRHFTPDWRTMIMAGTREGERTRLIALDLVDGEYRDLGPFAGGRMGIPIACAPHARVAHLVVREGDHEELERVDIDSGERVRIRPSRDFGQIYDPGCTADGRYVLAPDSDDFPRGVPLARRDGETERDASRRMRAKPGINRYYRIDLETGDTDDLFALEDIFLGHPNPNPVYPHLFMCSREARDPTHRVGIFDMQRGRWLETDFPFVHGHCSHEMWSADGRSVWGHAGYLGYQNIAHYPLTDAQLAGESAGDNSQWQTALVPIGSGDSAHVHISPDQTFLVGDGKNFGWNTEHEAAGKAAEVLDHAFDGVGAHSPGEVIWHFTMPRQSIIELGNEPWQRRDDLFPPSWREPERFVSVQPVCRFRSRMRLINKTMRLESNAHVMPDNRWVIFTSCSEDATAEIWAARLPTPS